MQRALGWGGGRFLKEHIEILVLGYLKDYS